MSLALSIVIPSHSRPDLLARCLQSLENHRPAGTEVIVVDDGSPDAVVSATAARFAGVGIVHRRRAGGFCVAANAGLAQARAAVVQLLNDDTEVCPGWAEAALPWFDDALVGAVAPLTLAWPGQAVDSAGDCYFLGGVAGKRQRGQSPAKEGPREVFGASASSAFFRRDAVLRLGGFPEEFVAYFEDVDLSFRLHRAGFRVIHEPASRVLHRVSASYGQKLSPELARQQSRNEELVFWRNIPACDLPRALPWHLAVLLGKAWRRWREGGLGPFLRGRVEALARWADLARHRRRLRKLGPEMSSRGWLVQSTPW